MHSAGKKGVIAELPSINQGEKKIHPEAGRRGEGGHFPLKMGYRKA